MDDKSTGLVPKGDLIVSVLAMPSDTNPNGDIFGGFVLSQMDIAGGVLSKKESLGRTVTVSVDSMVFKKPVAVGDLLCCYASVVRRGNTSITLKIEAWVQRELQTQLIKVTEGIFTYVAIDEAGKPRPITSPPSSL